MNADPWVTAPGLRRARPIRQRADSSRKGSENPEIAIQSKDAAMRLLPIQLRLSPSTAQNWQILTGSSLRSSLRIGGLQCIAGVNRIFRRVTGGLSGSPGFFGITGKVCRRPDMIVGMECQANLMPAACKLFCS
ncbi:MAG: hypothetical protein HY290_15440 [Planctomycetia bacterium]|nr:hypothetical protein [Planctomycetia bacterium]